jgi:hypothetical protein
MLEQNPVETVQPPPLSKVRHRGAIWTLLILAPVIAEVLTGSTRLSFIFVLIPEIMVWGGGALLCRELVRRWRGGGPSLLLLGLALSVAEEFLIQQTSLAPLPFPGANAADARAWGVNWVYLLFMLGFESVWVVVVPVQMTELIFPKQRPAPWLHKRGIIVTCVAFLVGCRIAWYGWTQQALKRLNVAPYHPPAVAFVAGAAAILLLIAVAWMLRAYGHAGRDSRRATVTVWLPAIAALVLSAGWFELMGFVFSPHPMWPAARALATGVAWGAVAFALFMYFAAARGWSDIHRWAVCFASTLGIMGVTFVGTSGWSKLDLVGKIVLNVLACAGFVLLGLHIQRRNSAG